MTDARHRGFWHRTGPAAVFAMLAVAANTEGCSCDDTSGNNPAGSGTSTSSSGAGGGGGGSPIDAKIDPAAQGNTPFDATPDPDGTTIYFTAVDPAKGAGVFKVAAAGGAVSEVKVGDPFVAPFGIAIGNDGKQLYVADPASESGDTVDDDGGQIFVLPTAGGTPTSLSGTAGLTPRGVEVVKEGSGDVVYFTGRDDSGAGVFKVPASGGTAKPVVSGDPFVDPTGVAIASTGDVYVADTVSAATHKASIFKITAGETTAKALIENLEVGYPAGVALTADDSTLFVSGLDPVTLTDVVIVVDLGTGMQSTYIGDADTDISAFSEPAGLHRAKNKDVFSWADSKANTGGTVFVITM